MYVEISKKSFKTVVGMVPSNVIVIVKNLN